MTEENHANALKWELVEASHLRANTDEGFDYDIIATPDGQVSWQGRDFGEWKYERDVEAAKLAAQAEFDDCRSRRFQSL